MNIDFFIDNASHFAQKKITLENLIDEYFLTSKKHIKNSKSNADPLHETLNSMSSFDEFFLKKEREFRDVDHTDYLATLYRCFDINIEN